ncbi:MAG: hypothetical protein ACJ748_03795, partial [Flavisolibacter sp.]
MKNFFIYAALCSSLIASCQNSNKKPQTEKETSDNESSQETKKVSKRDYSITKANSYSDLFLDSSAMESFFR